MPFCPECEAEYRAGFTQCSDCGVDLVDQLPAPTGPQPTTEDIDLVEIAQFKTRAQAAMIKELLENEGIVCVYRGSTDPITPLIGLAPIDLSVGAKDEERALSIIDSYYGDRDSEDEGSEDEAEDSDSSEEPDDDQA